MMRSWAYNCFGVLMGTSWRASGPRWPSVKVDSLPMITLLPSQRDFYATADTSMKARCCTLFVIWLLVFAGPQHLSAAVDFVHLTDPHLFGEDKENEKALSDCIEESN